MPRVLLLLFILGCLHNTLWGQVEINLKSFEALKLKNEEMFNTNDLEFSPFFYNNYIGFVYANPKADMDKEIDEHFFDLGISAVDFNGNLNKRAGLSKGVNSEFHEGPASFVSSTGELFFTRVFYDKSKTTRRDTIQRAIFVAKTNTNFDNAKKLSFYEEKVSICHPSLNPSGSMMVYSSDNSASVGKMDLFSSIRNSGKWGQHEHLINLNSEYNEVFPYIYQDTLLFFASDRPGGKGGLDIYVSTKTDTSWSDPVALPYPINTIYDDFGIIINENRTKGYMTSSRPGGKGKDDIYSFNINDKLWALEIPAPVIEVKLTILDKLSLMPVDKATIEISDVSLKNNKYDIDDFNVDVLAGEKQGEILMKLSPKGNEKMTDLVSNNQGVAYYELPSDKKYLIRCLKEGFEDAYILFDPNSDDAEINIVVNPIPPPPKIEPVKVEEVYIPTTVGEVVVFNNIYYDRNSDVIKPGAAKELDALAKTMSSNLTMKVELAAHTDSRGEASYNQDLSIKRAASAKSYLVAQGISEARIRAIGYGESKIRNHCTEGVKCSEIDHEYNRRTEVTVIE